MPRNTAIKYYYSKKTDLPQVCLVGWFEQQNLLEGCSNCGLLINEVGGSEWQFRQRGSPGSDKHQDKIGLSTVRLACIEFIMRYCQTRQTGLQHSGRKVWEIRWVEVSPQRFPQQFLQESGFINTG
jgi:hypothetical protein